MVFSTISTLVPSPDFRLCDGVLSLSSSTDVTCDFLRFEPEPGAACESVLATDNNFASFLFSIFFIEAPALLSDSQILSYSFRDVSISWRSLKHSNATPPDSRNILFESAL